MLNDLISRQAAIDAINENVRCGAIVDQSGLELAYEIIKELPSASNEKWIPVGERLPEEGKEVLIA